MNKANNQKINFVIFWSEIDMGAIDLDKAIKI